jgi:hypothetical protein
MRICGMPIRGAAFRGEVQFLGNTGERSTSFVPDFRAVEYVMLLRPYKVSNNIDLSIPNVSRL